MDKYIFLDLDGVIATEKSFYRLDKKKLKLLGEILEKTGAKIVVSSSWRSYNLEATKKDLSTPNESQPTPFPFVDKIVGVTVRGSNMVIHPDDEEEFIIPRGVEIDNWLRKNIEDYWDEDSYRYVIIDDENNMLLTQKDNFIQTDYLKGLSRKDVNKAIKILNGE